MCMSVCVSCELRPALLAVLSLAYALHTQQINIDLFHSFDLVRFTFQKHYPFHDVEQGHVVRIHIHISQSHKTNVKFLMLIKCRVSLLITSHVLCRINSPVLKLIPH